MRGAGFRQPLMLKCIGGLVCVCLTQIAWAQLQLTTVRGTALGPDGRPVPQATVRLLDPLGKAVASTMTDALGIFLFHAVAPGTYSLQAETAQLRSPARRLTVNSALPIEAEIRLATRLDEKLIVTDSPEVPAVTKRFSLAGESVRRSPVYLQSRGLQAAVATLPGFSTEDSGLLHHRGVDDGILYVQDGLPIYDRIDTSFGVAPGSSTMTSINVLTGYIPPEFGFKSGGVVEVRSEAGLRDSWSGTFDLGLGSYATREVSAIALGPLTRNIALSLSFAGEESGRFLDPVHPSNFHNEGDMRSGALQLSWNPSPQDWVAAGGGYGWSGYDVTHGETQEAAGQDQRQLVEQNYQSLSWQRFWTSRTVSQMAAFRRVTRGGLRGSSSDTPLFADSDRSLSRWGFIASITHHCRQHVFKAGTEMSRIGLREFFSFAVTDQDEEAGLSAEALEFTPDRPFVFRDSVSRPQWSFYLQDSFRPLRGLTLDLGVRFDRNRLLVSENQWSPRLGISYTWESTRTTLRSSLNRFFQPPQAEYLLLSSSPQAQALSPFIDDLGAGGAELRAERQTAFELGAEQWIGDAVSFDVVYWRRRVKNYGDPNVFFGTTIIFPNSVASGRAAGVDLRVEVPRRRGWSGFLSYSNSRVVQYGPINGGLFLEDEIIDIGPGTPFTPDHDQRNVGAAGATYEHATSGFWFSFTGRHESGTPLEVGDEELDELMERPGSDLVNFDRGRVKPRTLFDVMVGRTLVRRDRFELNARLEILNLTNQSYALNFGNPFSGTHFGAPLTMALKLRFNLR
jgi:TonB dependent receptor/Carboxypeptidase regulatory-like domain